MRVAIDLAGTGAYEVPRQSSTLPRTTLHLTLMVDCAACACYETVLGFRSHAVEERKGVEP